MPKLTTPRTQRTPRKKKIEAQHPELESQLEEIYQEPDGSIPDMRTIESRGSRTGMVVTFLFLLFLAAAGAAAWLGFFIFNPSEKFSENQVIVDVHHPSSIVAGQENEYVVTIKNTGTQPLAASDTSIKLPEDFYITSSSPAPTSDKKDRWVLGSIAGGESKKVTIKGVYAQQKGTQGLMRVLVGFKPSNFNAEFQKVVQKELVITQESLALAVEKKSADAKDEYIVKYKNLTDRDIKDGTLTFYTADAFKVSKTTPATKQTNGMTLLAIPVLEAGKEGALSIVGSAATGTTVSPVISFTTAINGADVVIAKISPTAEAPKAVGGLTFDVEGKTNVTVHPGDAFTLKVAFTNTTGKAITNASVVMSGDAPSVKNKSILDFSNLQTQGEPDVVGKQLSPERRAATLTWNGATYPALVEIKDGATVVITARVSARPSAQIDGAPKTNHGTFTATLKADGVQLVSEPVTIKVMSDLAVSATSTLVDGGQTEIKITATNSWHDLENVVITVPLFSHVGFVSAETSAGSATRTEKNAVQWTITKWPATVATQTLTIRATASKTQGQTAFSEPIAVFAADTATKTDLTLTAKPVPSN